MKWKNVYIISADDGSCKIGVSNNVMSRLVNLQSGRGTLRLIAIYHRQQSDGRLVERVAHRLLESKRISPTHNSEWFNATDDEAVAAVQGAIGLVDSGDLSILKRTSTVSHHRIDVANLTNSVALRVDQSVHRALTQAAAADGRSLSSLMAMICSRYVSDRMSTRSDSEVMPVTDWIDQPVKPRKKQTKS